MVKKFGLIICSRIHSSRLPRKPFLQVNGRNLIDHLLGNCVDTGIQTILAVPYDDINEYRRNIKHKVELTITSGSKDDPLERMYNVAMANGFDHVIRVCHDKIFIDHRQVREFINRYLEKGLEYIYSTNFIDGMSFEIFSIGALRRANEQFKNVEHISFAIDAVTERKENFQHFTRSKTWLDRRWPNSGLRLLIDHPEDYKNICDVVAPLNGQINIDVVLKTIDRTKPRINPQPYFTVYTCSYNDHEYLCQTIESVLSQSFRDFEYILVDDGSTDPRVMEVMEKYADQDDRIRIVRNKVNCGLSTSSNTAVTSARGKYCMRLDADDYLLEDKILEEFIKKSQHCYADIIYPNYIRDGKLMHGDASHHVGGAMFRKRALDFLRFTDNLRHFDSQDIYARAVENKIKIDYWATPVFMYRNRPGSLSNNLTSDRLSVKEKLAAGRVGDKLL